MGCAYSRICEENPRTFYVWNVDSEGRSVKPGRIEVTDNQLILHQKENVVVRWPLTSLRRYGFDSQVFSFECGRRCTTGAGVYAFKCRRAQQLFTILQECINNSGGATGDAADAEHLNSLSRPLLPVPRYEPYGNQFRAVRPSSPTVDSDGYLEPISAGSHLHCPGPSATVNRVPGSPGSYICVHGNSHVSHGGVKGLAMSDWTSSLPRCCSLGSSGRSGSGHHYVNEMAEQCLNGMCIVNQYVNSPGELNENTYVNSAMVTLSPGHLPLGCCQQCVDVNTNYAKLDDLLKQEQQSARKQHKDQHFYVNVKPDGARNSGSSGSSKCVSGRSSPTEIHAKSGTVTSLTSAVSPQRCYANLGSPTNSTEQAQVNYAVLDLDETAGSAIVSPVSAHNSMYSLASSPVKSPEGYAQIDFDKTVALSNSSNPCTAFNDDSMRKTRHNAVIPCNSQTV